MHSLIVTRQLSVQLNAMKDVLYNAVKVADLDALLNRSRRRRTHARQHQTQIMARASQRNEDRATILLHNNPLPQIAYNTADDLTPAPSHHHAPVNDLLSHPLCLCPSCSCSYHIFSLRQLATLTIHNSLPLSLPAQDLPLSLIFPAIDSLTASGLTPRTSRPDRFF